MRKKNLIKIKISLRQSVEKLKSRKRYFYLFVLLGVFISEIELPRISTYLLKFLTICRKTSSKKNTKKMPAAKAASKISIANMVLQSPGRRHLCQHRKKFPSNVQKIH